MIEQPIALTHSPTSSSSQIRNIAIIGNIQTGKVTLFNTLLSLSPSSPLISPQDQRGMYIMRCNQFLFNNKAITCNYVCSRGKLDFIDEISSILRVVDGAFVMIDALEGVSVLVEMALMKCVEERIQPVIVINKIDNLLIYVKYNEKEFYDVMSRIVGQINDIIKAVEGFECNIVDNLIYASLKYNIVLNKRVILDILLQNQTQVKKWNRQKWLEFDKDGKNKEWTLENIVRPVCEIMKERLKGLEVSVKEELECKPMVIENNNVDTAEISQLAAEWFSPNEILKKTIVNILPSPQQSQLYRAKVIYTGDIIDPCGQGITKCSPDAPLMMYVTNAISDPDNKNNIYRLARIYSGTLTKGDKVKILDRKYKFGSKSNILFGAIKLIMQPVNGGAEFYEKAAAGSLVCVTGVDHKIVRAATVTNFDLAHPIAYLKSIQKRIAAFVRCEPENYSVMLEGLKQLSRRRQGLRYKIQQTGEAFVLGSSEGTVLAYIEELKHQFNFQIKASKPFVRVKETITQPSSQPVMSKSGNKQNRVHLQSLPIQNTLSELIENGELRFYGDKEARNQRLVKQFGWESDDAIRIWSFGPDERGPNILVDKTDHPPYLNEVKDSIITGFNLAAWHGVLIEQPLRGVRINLNKIEIAEAPEKRLSGQIIRAITRAVYGCELVSAPALLQPIFLCQIKIKGEEQKQIEQMIKLCRGKVININDLVYKKIIDAYIPAIEKKVFEDKFMGCSYSMEYFQSIYHHDEIIPNFSLEEGTPTHDLLLNLRKRKGLPEYIPNKNDYIDKL